MALLFFLFSVAPDVVDRLFADVIPVVVLPEGVPDFQERDVRYQFLATAFLGVLYVGHVLWAYSTTEYITLSASHLLAPTLFAGGAFVRMYQHSSLIGYVEHLFPRPALQATLLLFGVQAITLLIARHRMLRVWRRFRGMDWDLVMKTRRDRSWLTLMLARIQPAFYPPHSFRACPEGIVVEGFTFAMPVAFREIERVYPVGTASLSSPGTYLASSATRLVAVKLYEEDDPFLLSPDNPERFCAYCQDRLNVLAY